MSRVGRVAQIVLGFIFVGIGVLWLLFLVGVALFAVALGGDASGYLKLLAWAAPAFGFIVVGSLIAFHAAQRAPSESAR